MANLKKENDAIQAKEIGQGGLTQGQQTQMARNEQRIAQVFYNLSVLMARWMDWQLMTETET